MTVHEDSPLTVQELSGTQQGRGPRILSFRPLGALTHKRGWNFWAEAFRQNSAWNPSVQVGEDED